MSQRPEDQGAYEPDDATIVARADDTVVVAGDETVAAVSDHTVVVTRDETVAVGDGTIVVTQDETVAVGDGTIVVAQDETVAVGDGTIVVPAAAASAAASTGDGTRRGRRAQHLDEQRLAEQRGQAEQAGESGIGAEEHTRVGRSVSGGDGSGLDAQRPIAPIPGMLPWDVRPAAERGVSQGLPVSYGARTRVETPLQTGVDEAQRRVGPAPEATPVRLVEGRSELPSLQQRDRRRNGVTLALYLAGTLACLLGLWGVASIAFG